MFATFICLLPILMAFAPRRGDQSLGEKSLTPAELARIDRAAAEAKLAAIRKKHGKFLRHLIGFRERSLIHGFVLGRIEAVPQRPDNRTTSGLPSQERPQQSLASATNQGRFSTTTKASLEAVRKRTLQSAGPSNAAGEHGGAGCSKAPCDQASKKAKLVENPPYMRGRLRAKLAFWSTFAQSTMVLSWIAHGFPLLWKQGVVPPTIKLSNHDSVYKHDNFVTDTINEYVLTGV